MLTCREDLLPNFKLIFHFQDDDFATCSVSDLVAAFEAKAAEIAAADGASLCSESPSLQIGSSRQSPLHFKAECIEEPRPAGDGAEECTSKRGPESPLTMVRFDNKDILNPS